MLNVAIMRPPQLQAAKFSRVEEKACRNGIDSRQALSRERAQIRQTWASGLMQKQ
jgi:hypothetical protein